MLSTHNPSDGATDVRDVAERSLGFLGAIERTTHNLERSRDALELLTRHAKQEADSIKANPPPGEIDPDGSLADVFEKVEDTLRTMYGDALRRRTVARGDRQLVAEDGVEDGYTAFIAAIADLHEAIHDLRDAVATLDALHGPRSERFTDVNALFSSLGL